MAVQPGEQLPANVFYMARGIANMTDVLNPFSEADLAEIDEAIERSRDAEKGIIKAQSAGLPVEGFLEDVRKNRERLMQIKRVYNK